MNYQCEECQFIGEAGDFDEVDTYMRFGDGSIHTNYQCKQEECYGALAYPMDNYTQKLLAAHDLFACLANLYDRNLIDQSGDAYDEVEELLVRLGHNQAIQNQKECKEATP